MHTTSILKNNEEKEMQTAQDSNSSNVPALHHEEGSHTKFANHKDSLLVAKHESKNHPHQIGEDDDEYSDQIESDDDKHHHHHHIVSDIIHSVLHPKSLWKQSKLRHQDSLVLAKAGKGEEDSLEGVDQLGQICEHEIEKLEGRTSS